MLALTAVVYAIAHDGPAAAASGSRRTSHETEAEAERGGARSSAPRTERGAGVPAAASRPAGTRLAGMRTACHHRCVRSRRFFYGYRYPVPSLLADSTTNRRPGPSPGAFFVSGARDRRRRKARTMTTDRHRARTDASRGRPPSAIPVLRAQIDAMDEAIVRLVAERAQAVAPHPDRPHERRRHPRRARPRARHPRHLPRRARRRTARPSPTPSCRSAAASRCSRVRACGGRRPSG